MVFVLMVMFIDELQDDGTLAFKDVFCVMRRGAS